MLAERRNLPEGDYAEGLAPENVIDIPGTPKVLYGFQFYVWWEREGSSTLLWFKGFGADFLA